MAELTDTDIREHVRARYAAAATAPEQLVRLGASAGIAGCGPDIAATGTATRSSARSSTTTPASPP